MSSTKNKVKDIAALFGEQINVKKAKSRRKSKARRNSDTIRRKKRNLRNTKSPKHEETNTDTNAFDIALKSTATTHDNDTTNIDSSKQRGETAEDIITTYNDDDMSDIDDIDIDIDEFMHETYGGWAQWSHSSYLSSISCNTFEYGDDARNSICDDIDTEERQTDYHFTDDTNTNTIQENERLSQEIIHNIDGEMMARLKHLEEIGATHTRDYLVQQMNTTTSTDSVYTVNLFGPDDDYIDSDDSSCFSDAMDLVVTDEDRMTVSELLIKFGIYAFIDCDIYNYFGVTLNVRYCCEIINILPIRIRKPLLIDCNIKRLMKLNKMCMFISRCVIDGVWDGLRKKEWMQLEHNCIYNVYQHKSYLMSCMDNDRVIYNENRMILNGFEKKYLAKCDRNVFCDGKVIVFKVIVEKLSDKYRFEAKLFKIGVECGNESLYITDRLTVRQNENYLKSMFIGRFVENGSEMIVRLSYDDHEEYLNINICHDPKGQCTRFDHKSLSNTFRIKVNPNKRIKVFIEQYNGEGIYNLN